MHTPPRTGAGKSRFDNLTVYFAVVLSLLLGGAGACAYLFYTRPRPSGNHRGDPGRLVRVFKAEKTSHRTAVRAYGTSRASEVWTAIAEVAGRTVKVHPGFEAGEVLSKDTLLVEIDPTDYQLAVTRYDAEVRAKQEELRELTQTEINLKEILKLQEYQQGLAGAEYERQRKLFGQNAVPRSALEAAADAYWKSLTTVQQTRNSLALVPVQRDLIQAALSAAEAQWNTARRNLSKCQIRLPFAARCASKSVELDQYVAPGERLGSFLALEMAEVVAMVETRKMPALFPQGVEGWGSLDLIEMADVPLWKRFPIPVEVRWGLDERRWVWPGRVARLAGSLDPGTRTVPVIIEVPNPYEDIRPGVRPPLVPDAFCEVTAYGTELEDVVLIPRDALHDNQVYLLRDGKLHKATVEVLTREDELAVIKEGGTLIREGQALVEQGEALIQEAGQPSGSGAAAAEDARAARQRGRRFVQEGQTLIRQGEAGVKAGDLVILTDLFPASEGMPVRGRLVESPVKPRQDLDFPEDLFQDDEATEDSGKTGPPAGPSRFGAGGDPADQPGPPDSATDAHTAPGGPESHPATEGQP